MNEKKPVKIVFASTNYGPLWAPAVNSWLGAIAYTQGHLVRDGRGYINGTGISDRHYVHSADCQLVKDFLADEEATHLWHTESDMILPPDCVLKLLALAKPIASGLYFLRQGEGQPCLYVRSAATDPASYGMCPVKYFPRTEPFQLKGCPGLGCVLFERRVFETLPYPWFDLAEGKYGSDLYFYTNALKAGIEVWVDPTVLCQQIEYTVWDERHYQRALEDPNFGVTGFIIGE